MKGQALILPCTDIGPLTWQEVRYSPGNGLAKEQRPSRLLTLSGNGSFLSVQVHRVRRLLELIGNGRVEQIPAYIRFGIIIPKPMRKVRQLPRFFNEKRAGSHS
jgi:hypothetical protein